MLALRVLGLRLLGGLWLRLGCDAGALAVYVCVFVYIGGRDMNVSMFGDILL